MSSKRKEYNNEPTSVWQNLIFMMPICVALYFLCQLINFEYEGIENWVKYGFIIAIIYFIYVTVRGILTKNKNIKQYCCSLVLISIILLSCFFTIFRNYNIYIKYNESDPIGQIDYISSSQVNARLENYCGENVRGSSVIQLQREIDILTAQKFLDVELSGTENIKSNKRYNVLAHKSNNNIISVIMKEEY